MITRQLILLLNHPPPLNECSATILALSCHVRAAALVYANNPWDPGVYAILQLKSFIINFKL